MNSLAWLGILVALLFVCCSLFLWVAARIAQLPKRTFLRCVGATMVLALIRLVATAIASSISSKAAAGAGLLLVAVGLFFIGMVFDWIVIRRFLGGSRPRVAGAWLLSTMLSYGASFVLVYVLFKPYVAEAFVVPTHSMEPTIRSWRVERALKDGDVLIIPVPESAKSMPFRPVALALHTKDFTAEMVDQPDTPTHDPDRFICNKLKQPKRWDIICYSMISNGVETKFVKRLVGMPGEEIIIDDGDVWVNGQRIQKPDSLRALKYVGAIGPEDRDVTWATRQKPIKLGSDEFFVLGDNTHASADSRSFGSIPRSAILGVVDLIYFPLSRWQIFP